MEKKKERKKTSVTHITQSFFEEDEMTVYIREERERERKREIGYEKDKVF